VDAGILVLRRRANLPLDDQEDNQEVDLRVALGHTLRLVGQSLGWAEVPTINEEANVVPWQLVSDLRLAKGDSLGDFVMRLEQVADKLDDPEAEFEAEDFRVLDELSATAEADATTAFSRMTSQK